MRNPVAAVEGVGLDPQMGFLHALRPGRAALALDVMEELRSMLADRLELTLINRRQVAAKHFQARPGGAVHLEDEARKFVIVAYQKRKQEEITHPLLEQKCRWGSCLTSRLACWRACCAAIWRPILHSYIDRCLCERVNQLRRLD